MRVVRRGESSIKIQWKFDEREGKLDENDIKVFSFCQKNIKIRKYTWKDDSTKESFRWDDMSFN